MLDRYLQEVQGLIRDRNERYMNLDDLRGYINRARREIAERTQCIRILTPISGSILDVEVTAAGTNYTAPVATISAPDFPSGLLPYPAGRQSTASALTAGGMISSISVGDGGSGYFQPTVTITDATGTGATAVAHVSPINVTQANQEVFPFSGVPLFMFEGVGEILAVKSVSFIFSNYRYSLPCYPFSIYQGLIRNYPQQFLYVPTICAQYAWGAGGSIYMYPIPSSIYQMEWDCFCLPTELVDDGTAEAIEQPWQDAVAMGAAVYAFEELQSYNNAKYWQAKFDEYCHRFSNAARPGRITSVYGRWAWIGAAILPILGAAIGGAA
jgi:hypothetical protein